ncbi:glucose 1-dehydrogenase [Microlunatus lacustris]
MTVTAVIEDQVLPDLPPRRRPGGRGGRLAGRVALVSGAAGALGSTLVARFAAEGAAVLATDQDLPRCQQVVAQTVQSEPGARVLAAALDVTDGQQWTRALRLARRSLGPVDLLVNNAGTVDLARLDAVTPDDWQRLVAVNQTAVLTGIQRCLPTMWQAGGGSVVNIGSVFGLVGTGGSFAYHATKGALISMTTAAAVELARRRVRVNAVLPGLVPTPMTADLPADFVAGYVAATPLARLASCEDVAAAVVFLASDEADFITGVCLPVDGGYTAR